MAVYGDCAWEAFEPAWIGKCPGLPPRVQSPPIHVVVIGGGNEEHFPMMKKIVPDPPLPCRCDPPGKRPEQFLRKASIFRGSHKAPSVLVLAEPNPPPGPRLITVLLILLLANTPKTLGTLLFQNAIPTALRCHSLGRLVTPRTSANNHCYVLSRAVKFK